MEPSISDPLLKLRDVERHGLWYQVNISSSLIRLYNSGAYKNSEGAFGGLTTEGINYRST